jgi:hypothetical protein
MKKLAAILICLSAGLTTFAQNSGDVLRYSRIYYSGTARFVGTGGAYGALGADISALTVNPAGIGLYQGSEFTFTLAPSVDGVTTDYLGRLSTSNVTSFGMGNVGFVFTVKPQGTAPLYNFNFGFAMNRQNDLNSEFYMAGPNHSSSILNVYTDKLNNNRNLLPGDFPFDIGPAYDAWLIYYDTLTNQYTSDQPHGGSYQSKQVRTYGSINEFDISMGGNVGDKLYFGLTFGIPFIRYTENSSYSEVDNGDSIPYFESMVYNYHLDTRGTGFVIKGGVIYRPTDWLRIGVAVHTPTWYPNMHDYWYTSTTAYYENKSWDNTKLSPNGEYYYYMRTPFRAIGSIAFVIGKYGLISGEYEYVNYSQGKLNSSGYAYSTVNDEIKNSFQSWGNIRGGMEWRIWDFRLRAGAAYYSNPYTTSGLDGSRLSISGGFGYRTKHFFTDVTYQWGQSKEQYYLYNYEGMKPSTNTYTSNTVLTTVGFRF